MPTLHAVEELESLLEDRPDQSRTFEVDPRVAAEVFTLVQSVTPDGPVREMDADEAEELARYLEIPFDKLELPLQVSDITCSGCQRRLTILDIAKTSVEDGLHSKALLAAVLSGTAGQFVTVRGKDGGRFANCAACGRQSDTRIYAYGCGFNAYAWA